MTVQQIEPKQEWDNVPAERKGNAFKENDASTKSFGVLAKTDQGTFVLELFKSPETGLKTYKVIDTEEASQWFFTPYKPTHSEPLKTFHEFWRDR